MTTTRTLDAYSRIGTAYVLIFAGFTTADEATQRDIVMFLDNIAASVGRPYLEREEAALPARILHDEFVTIIETLADSDPELHHMIEADFEELLAIYLPSNCIKHVVGHRLWEIDPKNWARLMAFILCHLTENEPAGRSITHVIGEFVVV